MRSSMRACGLLLATLATGRAAAATNRDGPRGVLAVEGAFPLEPASLVLPLLLVGALAAGTMAWRAWKRSGPPLDAEQLAMLADEAAQDGRPLDALWWMRRARTRDPESPRLLVQEGHLLGEAGRLEDALARFEAAARMVSDGEPSFLAARLLALNGSDPRRVSRHLADALGRTPSFVLDVPGDPVFRDVLAMPLLVDAQERAWRMLGQGITP